MFQVKWHLVLEQIYCRQFIVQKIKTIQSVNSELLHIRETWVHNNQMWKLQICKSFKICISTNSPVSKEAGGWNVSLYITGANHVIINRQFIPLSIDCDHITKYAVEADYSFNKFKLKWNVYMGKKRRFKISPISFSKHTKNMIFLYSLYNPFLCV